MKGLQALGPPDCLHVWKMKHTLHSALYIPTQSSHEAVLAGIDQLLTHNHFKTSLGILSPEEVTLEKQKFNVYIYIFFS